MFRDRATAFVDDYQQRLCRRLEAVDGKQTFREDRWAYEPGDGPGSGGGRTRVLVDGAVFEKSGVNVSTLEGRLSERIAEKLNTKEKRFFATGVSIVIHPESPHVPTTHANFRYLEMLDENNEVKRSWFGGGADLTPYYPDDDAAIAFHEALKRPCDAYGDDTYKQFKEACDRYFYLPHRNEARGIGGLFFDYLEEDKERVFTFIQGVAKAFLDVYPQIVEERKAKPWTEKQREWQLHRRGRYVEFNLIYDRGTLFGLETKGRTESILMSLPPLVKWSYAHEPEPGSPEAQLLEVVKNPREWV